MAIKTISKLDPYNNTEGEKTAGEKNLGGNIHLYKLKNQHDSMPAISDPQLTAYGKQQISAEEDPEHYFNLLFEVSKPLEPGMQGLNSTEFQSYKLPYRDLIKNVIIDTKQYLNSRNNLGDHDLCAITNQNYSFSGDKTFQNVYVQQELSARNAQIINEQVANLSVNSSLCVNCDVHAEERIIFLGDGFLSGYAYGLKNNKDEKTTIPSINITSNTSATLVGDPIWFCNGRPAQISCVNYATKAYNLVSADGTEFNVGEGGIHSDSSYPSEHSKWSAVYFKNGIPKETNVIDYACHSFWSDLGEKYLGDCSLEPGTLVQFGGNKEITVAKDKANAIVSTKAFDLNSNLTNGTVIALCGRVPTKIIGKVKKFDDIVLSQIPGVGRSKKWYDFFKQSIGKALENNEDQKIKLVECVTRFVI